MLRVSLGLMVVILGLASCSSDTGQPTSTMQAVPSATATEATTPAIQAITTTTQMSAASTEAEVVDICRKGEVWQPGVKYSAGCFVVPVVFKPMDSGWGSVGAGDDWLKLRWRDQGSDAFRVRVALISFSASGTPTEVLDRIAGSERISEVSERNSVFVGGASGYVVDVEGGPEPGGEAAAPGSGGCSGDSPVWFPRTYFGHPLLDGAGQDVVGVGACDVARVWAVQAGDLTLTIVGGTADPTRHPEAVARIEELFEGMSFEPGGGS